MKLYATVTSERATKGQGGQLYLHTNFNIGTELYYEFIMESAPNGEIRIQINDYKKNKLIYSSVHHGPKTKGEKQKGEHRHTFTDKGVRTEAGEIIEWCVTGCPATRNSDRGVIE